jgi:hypothetical protein
LATGGSKGTRCVTSVCHQVHGRFDEASINSGSAGGGETWGMQIWSPSCSATLEWRAMAARFDEASDYFEAALAIARAMGDRRRNQYLSYFGLLRPSGQIR